MSPSHAPNTSRCQLLKPWFKIGKYPSPFVHVILAETVREMVSRPACQQFKTLFPRKRTKQSNCSKMGATCVKPRAEVFLHVRNHRITWKRTTRSLRGPVAGKTSSSHADKQPCNEIPMAEPNQNRSKAKTKDIAGSRFLQFSHQVKNTAWGSKKNI